MGLTVIHEAEPGLPSKYTELGVGYKKYIYFFNKRKLIMKNQVFKIKSNKYKRC